MKVRELIDALQRDYDPEDALVVAFWDREYFDTSDLTPEQWVDVADYLGSEMDWSRTHERLSDLLADYLDNVEEDAA